MMLRTMALAAFVAAAAPAIGAQARDSGDTFNWKGQIPAGSWVRVLNLNGSIEVEAATGNTTEVQGVKEWRHGNPDDVHFVVEKHGNDVTICALWHEGNECDESQHGGYSHHHGDDNDVSVRFSVRLPKDVKVDVSTVNGEVSVDGATSAVEASSVNGHVDASSSGGPVRANAVNGSLHARMQKVPDTGDLDFESVNGSVTVEVPANLSAQVEMSTTNGSLRTDFPLTLQGNVNTKHLRGTIGNANTTRTLKLKSVNGSIELRKAG